jgi:hypothetical protein
MGYDLVEMLAEAKTFLGQAPGTTSDPAEQPAAGDGKQRPLLRRSRCLPRLSRSVRHPDSQLAQTTASRESTFP